MLLKACRICNTGQERLRHYSKRGWDKEHRRFLTPRYFFDAFKYPSRRIECDQGPPERGGGRDSSEAAPSAR